jgi:hypothetical protein
LKFWDAGWLAKTGGERSTSKMRLFVDAGGTHRIYVARLGPVGILLLALAICIVLALIFLVLLGALLIWIPVSRAAQRVIHGRRTSITMSSPAENTARIQRGRPFARGQSGNPAGKPLGARNKVTVEIETLMGKYGEQVAARVIERASKGDMVAARLVLERISPILRGRALCA